MRGLKAEKAMTIEDFGTYKPGLRTNVPMAGIKPWASGTPPGLAELDTPHKIAIAGGAGFLTWWLLKEDGDGLTPEQRAARRKTQKGSPTDTPGQVLPGAPDYIKIWQGQKIDALKRFGEQVLIPEASGHAYPTTTRLYAFGTVAKYWTDEINRLLGLDGRAVPFDSHDMFRKISVDDSSSHYAYPGDVALYNAKGIVSGKSANAIIKGWNKIRPELKSVVFGGNPGGVMSPQDSVRFWDLIGKLAIIVDVDRAVPDHTGYAWIAIRDEAIELPGKVGAAAVKIVSEVAGWGLSAVFGVVKSVVFSPIGIAGIGAAAYYVYRRRQKRAQHFAYINARSRR